MTINKSPLILPGLLGKWTSECLDISQMSLLTPSQFSSYAMERDVKFWKSHIKQLWQLKLLRADLIISRKKLRYSGLVEVGKDELNQYLYADGRQAKRRRKGWIDATENLPPFPEGVTLYFHSFRYYVLYQLNRVFKININPYQMMIANRYPGLLEREILDFEGWSSKPEFNQNVYRWNEIVSLCVVTEPCFFMIIFQYLSNPHSVGFEGQLLRIDNHWDKLIHCFKRLGLDELERIREGLCINAEMLDKNKDVHTLLRLSQGKFRQNVKGRIGGSLVLLTMAEVIRRATEKAFNLELCEEDELGFGMTPLDMKEYLYGEKRLLESRGGALQYIRTFELDFGTRVRWYVEGDTEFGALKFILGGFRSIEILNLKGNVVQGGSKGLAFSDNLKNDIHSQIFSVVLIDKDNDTYVRAVKKAADNDRICGEFYLSDPDFEFGNFSLNELEEVLWEIAEENGAAPNSRSKLHNKIKSATTGKELINLANRAIVELNRISKGTVWGEKLISYAWDNPEMRDSKGKEIGTRPIVDGINTSIRSINADYHFTRKNYIIDSDSGKLVKREDVT